MKVIERVEPPCPCPSKLWDFYNSQADDDGRAALGLGSVVECDCGQAYTLSESQRDGRYWVKRVTPLRAKVTMTTLRD